MKKLLGASLAVAMVFGAGAGVAMAKYGTAGCGLGSMLFDGNTKGKQILAATTNGIFGIQTFAITSGTSNCTAGGIVKADKQQEAFVEANFESLQRDLAAGEGEYLAAFSGLLGCSDDATPALASFAQENFEHFSGPEMSPHGMLYTMKSGLSVHPTLRTQCSRI
ncbi:MAG: DUF3015 family protein [Myxococcales bacterium]|nr:DUF3015 family protein [Myxococcales bacterium]MCB9523734.1 DUF3015 family protein [Myxococcales bacterium]